MVEPSWERLHREVDQGHIDKMEKEIRTKPENYYHLMVVNIPNLAAKQYFRSDNLQNKYILEVIGGNHSRLALQNILKACQPEEQHLFTKRQVKIYANLTVVEAQLIGTDSNNVHKLALNDSFPQQVQSMRTMLYVQGGAAKEEDMKTSEPPSDIAQVQTWKDQVVRVFRFKNVRN